MADYDYITAQGVIVPDTADTRAEIEQDFRDAFGQDLVVTPDTPQGVLITMLTLGRDGVARNNAALANQINPNLSGGVFLDAVWGLTGGQRVPATRSVLIDVALTGTPGALIPEGSQAQVGPGGAIFQSTGALTLSAGGTGSVNFQSLDYGPVSAAVGALNRIVTPVLGWETVSNPSPAQLGTETESDLAARERRRQTLALQGTALPEAIVSGLVATPDVSSVLLRENVTNAAIVIDSVTIDPHSILAVVDGGLDSDVAMTLLRNKSMGCGWTGDLTVSVVEPVSGQAYDVKFTRPDAIPIFMRVTVRATNAGENPQEAVRSSIAAYARGDIEGEAGLVIGADVSPFELAGAVNRLNPGLYVQNVEIGLTSGTLAGAVIPIRIVERAQVIEGNIEVVVV